MARYDGAGLRYVAVRRRYGSPMVGVPIGRNILSGATMCCDPISWFMRAKLISNPSMFVLGKPGLGKSTITRRMALGLAGTA